MAGDTAADSERLPEITDQVAERLFRSLELMEADYQRTLAAEPTAPQSLHPSGILREQSDSDEDAGSDGEEHGYAALGSEVGSDEEVGTDKGLCPATAEDDWGCWQSGAAEASRPAQPMQAWQDREGEKEVLESFANFGSSNPALPLPPAELRPIQANFLTEEEVKLIKETMQQICPPAPPWASKLSDEAFQRMIKESLFS
ncbi:unnamed protein product [Symbiodinium sp. KB8]|nr:unnamed protein product [Symbiodinium sp. KB8]